MAGVRVDFPTQPGVDFPWLSGGIAVQWPRMFQDTAPYANDGSVPGSPATIGIGCSMTGGCSGGPGNRPWLDEPCQWSQQLRPNNQPLDIYSPYFGDNAHSLLQLVNM